MSVLCLCREAPIGPALGSRASLHCIRISFEDLKQAQFPPPPSSPSAQVRGPHPYRINPSTILRACLRLPSARALLSSPLPAPFVSLSLQAGSLCIYASVATVERLRLLLVRLTTSSRWHQSKNSKAPPSVHTGSSASSTRKSPRSTSVARIMGGWSYAIFSKPLRLETRTNAFVIACCHERCHSRGISRSAFQTPRAAVARPAHDDHVEHTLE